ncbi:GGDEF domain-containing protein [Butyrivibrio sp. XBB1001]|uniref:GGDEF domain-containing protein n=1 Tax=Butyrivibrio sp. XBB1001 TaxID=1280682 RepID=UPI0004130805|nr:GGDEF domain-containing protein [Butyrivibrio sp. XBB1001]
MINGKKIIALCTYRIYESQEFTFLSELGKLMPDNNCQLFIYAMNSEIGITNNESAETAVFNLIPYDKVDVVVIMNEKIKVKSVTQGIIDKAKKAGVPVIVVDGHYEGVTSVCYDYAGGFEQVVRHVIEFHKVKRPHFMAGHKNNAFSEERLDMFKKVLAENNMPFDESMVSYGDFWALPCRAATNELLKRDVLPDSIICANDIMAINVCDVLNEAGIRVPEDIIVSGFDGIDEAFLSSPAITTAVCDNEKMAHAVMESLLDVLSGKTNKQKKVKPIFIANESCGCPREDHHIITTVSELNNLFYHHEDEIHVYQNVISKFMMGKELGNSIRYLKENHAKYAQVVVEKSCFNMDHNFFYDDIKDGEKIVVYDSYSDSDKSFPYNEAEIIPHLDEILKIGQPLIFNSLVYLDKCPGFVCYSYPRTMLIDYNQTPNLTNCFEMSIGGYVVTKYQQYLRDKIQKMYENDALTGLYNRLAFISKVNDLFSKTNNKGKMLNVIMLDLDGLKQINDNMGHMAGDSAIKAVATALKESVPDDAICVRAGGDEMFSLMVGDVDIEKICADIEEKLQTASQDLGFRVSASIGTHTSIYESNGDISKAIGNADEHMYAMKRRRKNPPK